jgi:hypothetical protein
MCWFVDITAIVSSIGAIKLEESRIKLKFEGSKNYATFKIYSFELYIQEKRKTLMVNIEVSTLTPGIPLFSGAKSM